MATFSEIDITFLDGFEFNTATNKLIVGYFDNDLNQSRQLTFTVVDTRVDPFEFSDGATANDQANFFFTAADTDLNTNWEVSILGDTVTIKSTVEEVQFETAFAGAPNDTRINFEIRNYSPASARTSGVLPTRSNYYVNQSIADPLVISQTVKMWFNSEGDFNDDYDNDTPQYILTQLRPSLNWSEFDLAISQYARDFIYPELPLLTAGLNPSKENSIITTSVSTRNNLQGTDQPILNQVITTLGYSTYSQGAQFIYDSSEVLLSSTRHQVKPDGKIIVPIYALSGITSVTLKDDEGTALESLDVTETETITDAIRYAVFDLSTISLGDAQYLTVNDSYRFELVDECIYETETVLFLNRFGVFEAFTFFKVAKESLRVESFGEFKNNYVNGAAYDANRHLYRSNGRNGRSTLQLTSGYISEQQNAAIEDLILSDYIYLIDGSPLNIDTDSIEKRTRIVDKLISYDISFKSSEDLIQTV
jgi:hypothetical protein